jgi:mRNA interferase MazF
MLRYKVVLVPFPFDDLSGNKVRPAVCLTESIGVHRQVVIGFITSQIPEFLEPLDLVLTENMPEFLGTGLKVSSTLRLQKMVTVTTRLIRRELGTLPVGLQNEVQHRLRLLFAL